MRQRQDCRLYLLTDQTAAVVRFQRGIMPDAWWWLVKQPSLVSNILRAGVGCLIGNGVVLADALPEMKTLELGRACPRTATVRQTIKINFAVLALDQAP
jgi:hypothetical protein